MPIGKDSVREFQAGDVVSVACRYRDDAYNQRTQGDGTAFVRCHGIYELPCTEGRGADGFLTGVVRGVAREGGYEVVLDTNGVGALVVLKAAFMTSVLPLAEAA